MAKFVWWASQQLLILLFCRVPDLLLMYQRHRVNSAAFWALLDNLAHGCLAFLLCFIAANGSLLSLFPSSSSSSPSLSAILPLSSSSPASSASSSAAAALTMHSKDGGRDGGSCLWCFCWCCSGPKAKTLIAGPLGLSLLAAFVACAMDLDHFIAAGSLRIRDATHLQSRPFAHSVTFALGCAVAAYVVPRVILRLNGFPSSDLPTQLFGVVLIAMLSHQIRDAHRRGLWFAPLGSTPPLPLLIYLALELALPALLRPVFARRVSVAAPLISPV